MFRSLAAVVFLALSTLSFADGPGTRIRAGPPTPQPASPAAERDLERCEAMRGDAKERCMSELRRAIRADDRASPHAGPGPETSGIGSRTGGTASAGGTAPR